MDMTPDRWSATSAYLREVFGREDAALASVMPRAVAAGLPDIAVSADVGRLLMLLTSMTGSGAGARLALELVTLAGYSGTWMARGLAPGGKLVTIEPEPKHADFAQRTFVECGVADRVTVQRAGALEILPRLASEYGTEALDVIFFDAIKAEYPAYFEAAAPLLKPGGLLIADNTLGGGDWWIDAAPGANNSRDAVDRFNRMVAGDPRFDAACVPIREGVMIARRR